MVLVQHYWNRLFGWKLLRKRVWHWVLSLFSFFFFLIANCLFVFWVLMRSLSCLFGGFVCIFFLFFPGFLFVWFILHFVIPLSPCPFPGNSFLCDLSRILAAFPQALFWHLPDTQQSMHCSLRNTRQDNFSRLQLDLFAIKLWSCKFLGLQVI